MNEREALKLALEALENAEYGDYDKKELNEAITAIREALAEQPAQQQYQSTADKCQLTPVPAKGGLLPAQQQKPYGYVSLEDENKFQFDKPEIGRWQTVYTTPFKAQPEQEPVAWLHWLHGPVRLFLNKDEAMMELDRLNREYPVDKDARQMKPLYTTPPHRKPWVGLTDDEVSQLSHHELWIKNFIRQVEAKLRSKNT